MTLEDNRLSKAIKSVLVYEIGYEIYKAMHKQMNAMYKVNCKIDIKKYEKCRNFSCFIQFVVFKLLFFYLIII